MDFDWNTDTFADTDVHTECVRWTTDQLERKPRVTRMSYDMWFFERKRDIEEFRTFWLLKWS